MNKTVHKLPSNYQIINVCQDNNLLYLLDIDQKLIIINFENVNKENFFLYSDISITNRKIKEIPESFGGNNIKTIFLPFRTFSKRMDEVITLEDYQMNVFLHVHFLDRLGVFIGKNTIMLADREEILQSPDLLNFETYTEYQKSHMVVLLKVQIEIAAVFKIETLDDCFLFVVDLNNALFVVSKKMLSTIWDYNATSPDKLEFMRMDSESNQVRTFTFNLHPIYYNSDCSVPLSGIVKFSASIYLYTNNQKLIFRFSLDQLKEELDSYLCGTLPSSNLKIEQQRKPESHRGDTFFTSLHSNFSNYFTRIVSSSKLAQLLSDSFAETEKIVKDFICYSENESKSYYLILTDQGNILFFPLFFSIVENENVLEFYHLKTDLPSIKQAFYIKDNLIIANETQLFVFDFEKSLWDVKQQIEVENVSAIEIAEKGKVLGFAEKLPHMSASICLRLVESDFGQKKTLLLKGRLESIQYIQQFNSGLKATPLLSQILVLVYANKNIQLLMIKDLIYLLEDFSHENKFISAVLDSESNFLHLCYEEGIVEVFRFELDSVASILSKKETLHTFFPSNERFHQNLQNKLKDLIEHLTTVKISPENPGLLKKLMKSYYHSFADFNNIKWFSQSEIVQKTDYNDLLLFHLKSFFNYCNICFNEVNKACECSSAINQKVGKVFGLSGAPEAGRRASSSPMRVMAFSGKPPEPTPMQNNTLQKELFSVDMKHLHLFLNNLNKDRFAFAREKFSILPILYLIQRNKDSFAKVLNHKYKFKETADDFFYEMYRSFFSDPLKNILLTHRDSENIYMNFTMSGRLISGVSYNTGRMVKSTVDWKYEYLSYFFHFILQYMDSGAVSVLSFANSFGLKVPLVKFRVAYQGLSNTLTFQRTSLDSIKFLDIALEQNSHLHLNILTNLTAFLISNNQIALHITNAFSNEIFKKLILSRKAPINIFILVLYFFNDSLPLSASAHYLINKFSKERDVYTKKLEASSEVKQKMKLIFKQQISKLPNPECLSKLELTFLMATLLLIPPVEWIGDSAITSTILSFISLIT